MFITLTFDTKVLLEECLSSVGLMTLKKEHLQNFMKRLRKRHEVRNLPPIKYYAVGEYGSKHNRPHYHVIIFNALMEDIEAAWMKGYVHYGTVTGASIGYTLKYMCKKSKPVGVLEGDDREPEFALMSKGLGKNYLSERNVQWHLKDVKNRMYINVGQGKKATMPRYYKDKLFTDDYFPSHDDAITVRQAVALQQMINGDRKEQEQIDELGEDRYEHEQLYRDINEFNRLESRAKEGDIF